LVYAQEGCKKNKPLLGADQNWPTMHLTLDELGTVDMTFDILLPYPMHLAKKLLEDLMCIVDAD